MHTLDDFYHIPKGVETDVRIDNKIIAIDFLFSIGFNRSKSHKKNRQNAFAWFSHATISRYHDNY